MEVLEQQRTQKINKSGVVKVLVGIGAFALGIAGMEMSTIIFMSQDLVSLNHAANAGFNLADSWINHNSEMMTASSVVAISGVSTILNGFNSMRQQDK